MLAQLYLSGVGGEEEHDGEARQQPGVLDGESEEEAAATCILFLPTHLVHLWKHVCQSDVQEHPPCQSKDPVGGEAVSCQDAEAHAQVTAASRQEVKEQSLLYAHASVQQDHKVPQLMGELLTQDGHRGTDALKHWGGEGCSYSQAVDEVVQAVAQRDHPGQSADVRIWCPL